MSILKSNRSRAWISSTLLGLFWLTSLVGSAFGADDASDRVNEPRPSVRIVDAAQMSDELLNSVIQSTLEFGSQAAGIPVLIETIPSLNRESIQDYVKRKEFAPGTEGLYVVLARKERRLEVHVAPEFQNQIDQLDQKGIREAFIQGLKEQNQTLLPGVRSISQVLAQAAKTKKQTITRVGGGHLDQPQGSDSPLVVRNQIKLGLAGARLILEGAEAKARELSLKVNISVVDDGGHLLAFIRMDGGRPASGYTSLTKAITAATFRQETGPLPKGAATPDVLLNLSLQNAAAASGGKVTTLYGGVPVVVDELVIGGVGVGGGTGEQDAMIAKAGIEHMLKSLKTQENSTSRVTANP